MLSAGGAWNRGADENARVALRRIARVPDFTACMLYHTLESEARFDLFNFTTSVEIEAKMCICDVAEGDVVLYIRTNPTIDGLIPIKQSQKRFR